MSQPVERIACLAAGDWSGDRVVKGGNESKEQAIKTCLARAAPKATDKKMSTTGVLYRSDSVDSGSASMCAEDEGSLHEDLLDMEGFSDSEPLMSSSEEMRGNFTIVPNHEKPTSGASISRRSSARRVTFDPNVLMKQAILEGDFSTLRTLLYQDAMEHDPANQIGRSECETASENHECENADSVAKDTTVSRASDVCGGSDSCATIVNRRAAASSRECNVDVRYSSQSSSTSSADSGADCDMSDVPDSPLCRSPRHSAVPRVDVNATDNDGLSLLHLCCFAGAADCVRLLVGRGAEVDAADEAGWTPLHVAAYEGLDEVVKTLASAGATLEARDEEGFRPEDVATSDRIRGVFDSLKQTEEAKEDGGDSA